MSSRSRRAAAGLAALLLAIAACQNKQDAAKLQQIAAVSAERDRLMQDMADNARLMSEIGSELSHVQMPSKALHVSTESPLRASRDSVIQKIRYIATKVTESEARLRESERRIHDLTVVSDSMKSTLETTLANYESMVETQKQTITSMTEQLTELSAQNAALMDTVNFLATATNKVYYVIGTEDDLVQRGIIKKEGGSHFLFVFGKRGETLVPARQLDPSAFLVLNNKRELREITLPDSTRPYRIASRQDLSALETPLDGAGRIMGSVLKIADPERFWATSKFLIIVES